MTSPAAHPAVDHAISAHPAAIAAIARARPRHPDLHLVETGTTRHLFLADGSRLYDAGPGLLAGLEAAIDAGDDAALHAILAKAGLAGLPRIDDAPLLDPPVHAISLAIAQACNLACSYCYAGEGSFGSAPRPMPLATAIRAIDLLLDGASRGQRVTIAFLGGEPLANRPALRAATLHAARRAAALGIDARFSITSNGTLLTEGDADFFEDHGFAVTLSIDGPKALHDAQRPTKGGRGSFDRVMAGAALLLARQRRMEVGARVTVTPANLALAATLDALIARGFASVGFSPMLRSPSGAGQMTGDSLTEMLAQMIACGQAFEAAVRAGRPYPFANMVNAMREIGRGTHRPYPCGAGAGYLGVAADGALAACHRFVGDPDGAMGSVEGGPDPAARAAWLEGRHVHRQEPCRSCWARYLCGGGCHHEVIGRGRPACDYIRGWLDYCLGAFLRLSAPDPPPDRAAGR